MLLMSAIDNDIEMNRNPFPVHVRLELRRLKAQGNIWISGLFFCLFVCPCVGTNLYLPFDMHV